MNPSLKLNVSTWNYECAHGKTATLEAAISEIKKDGLGVELSMNWSPELDIFDKGNWPVLKKWLTGVPHLSIHSRCDNKNWNCLKKEIELTAYLRADLLVVHVLNFGVIEAEGKLETDEAYFKKALDFAEEKKVTLALENGFLKSLKRFCSLAGERSYLKICLDIGHANNPSQSLLSGNSINTFIKEFGKKIVHLHFHDNHGETDEHLVPGEGNINWQEILGELKNAGVPLSGGLELRGNISDARKAYLQAVRLLSKSIPKRRKI